MRNKMFSVTCLNSMSWTSIFYIVLIFYILCIVLITPYEKIQKEPVEINKQSRKEWLEKELKLLQEEYDDITLSKKEIKDFIKKEIREQISIIYHENFLSNNE